MTKTQVKIKPYEHNPRQISKQEAEKLLKDLEDLGDLGGIVHDLNTNQIVGGHQRLNVMFGGNAEGFNVDEAQIEIVKKYPKPTKTGTVAEGYITWHGERFSYRQVNFNDEDFQRANIVANLRGGTWDYDVLANAFDSTDLMEWGFDENRAMELKAEIAAIENILGSEERIKEKAETLEPKKFMRVLVSIPVDSAIEAKQFFDELEKVDGAEIDYGAN